MKTVPSGRLLCCIKGALDVSGTMSGGGRTLLKVGNGGAVPDEEAVLVAANVAEVNVGGAEEADDPAEEPADVGPDVGLVDPPEVPPEVPEEGAFVGAAFVGGGFVAGGAEVPGWGAGPAEVGAGSLPGGPFPCAMV